MRDKSKTPGHYVPGVRVTISLELSRQPPSKARLFQTLMNTMPLIVQCDTETPHSLAGMAGGPSSRAAFISKKGCEANSDVSYC